MVKLIGLSFLVIVGWNLLFPPEPPVPVLEAPTAAQIAQKDADKLAAAATKRYNEVYAKAKAAADLRARTNPPASTITNIKSTLTSYCYDTIKSHAVYPTKVDFSIIFGTDINVYSNFKGTPGKPNRYMMRTTGEMMNGFGNMVPFTAACKVDFNNNEYSLVEVLIN